jgi:hypothetical protein
MSKRRTPVLSLPIVGTAGVPLQVGLSRASPRTKDSHWRFL